MRVRDFSVRIRELEEQVKILLELLDERFEGGVGRVGDFKKVAEDE